MSADGKTPRLDELDVKIIKELQLNARISFRELSKKLGVSVTTVSERVRKMVKSGLIKGFTTLVDPEKVGPLYCVALYIKVNPGFDSKSVGREVASVKGVCYVYSTVGVYHLIALGSAPTKEELTKLIADVSSIKGIADVTPSMILETIKEDPKHPVTPFVSSNK
ncbi:hypothetical protein B9Q13_03110 [Candidatus Marsarchaeota G2 archaeon ECH_B_SAG-G16]|jgi:DNA-binding Lrp family transcriptional regulator|uniref:HTH asnC-type domain-containing protein n=5 Tax=Candidatus Marsarchaeota TaxID=1978152 RepID=A0A2R6AGJ8_9ARCH|nr:MAG: hypothetical protein B9Q01_06460 [Candidatus Marsarchaeota G1 archaeon OSP_D]PSN85423.1 MAG: hypothetical protein B9Q02_06430 [Candidatus Marsarchaeota G1 archaeon BE_D]PSN88173.1 MAG: hypothetical protein B9Q00_06525 [Candidatus Marsarchaeota G1 archaeon OSP_C]PSN90403.1 MAG: hypothetical protein B9P99_04800 [Candidatus Marsarchaeota G1 archaeon OSP_B]PSO04979.1 MAG: hypothetical protein B9Q13_03110 [Candidatus Marsarchaeota G2 archaeon ECH_B_SAG-G16]